MMVMMHCGLIQKVLLPRCCDVAMVLQNICNMCSRDLPNMSALALSTLMLVNIAYILGKSLLPMLHI